MKGGLMQIVVNRQYGSFKIPSEYMIKHPDLSDGTRRFSRYDYEDSDRTSDDLVSYAKNNKESGLGVVYVPDEATDYRINDYDGLESVIYVLNGKIIDAKDFVENHLIICDDFTKDGAKEIEEHKAESKD